MGRKASRELAMKLIFQNEFQSDDTQKLVQEMMDEENLNDADREYIQISMNGVLEKMSFLDENIIKNAKGWKFARMSKVDISILRLAIFEIYFRQDIAVSIVINEAVELAKKYSSEDAGAFINGILGNIAREIDCVKPLDSNSS